MNHYLNNNNIMGRLLNYFLALLFAYTLLACSDKSDKGPDINPEPSEEIRKNRYVNKWILENMELWYLWNDKIPTNVNLTQNPEDFYNSLLYKHGSVEGDRFSWIQENFVDLLNSLSGVVKEAGYDYIIGAYGQAGDLLGVVTYIKPDSPAERAGLKRGNIFIEVNGKQLNRNNYEELLGKMSLNHTLGMATVANNTIYPSENISLSVVEYHENPVYLDTIYNIGGKKIAYLVYNFFSSDDGDGSYKYEKDLNNVFGNFKQEGIDDLIVDLRYNGGGLVSTAVHLASMIVENLDVSKIFIKNQYNDIVSQYIINTSEESADALVDKFTDKIEIYNGGGRLESTIPINNINLPRVYIITSFRTASSSELIINGLKPYIDVYLIGDNTVGKNLASISIFENNDSDNKWGMQPIITKMLNSQNYGDYVDGFSPDIEIDEFEYIEGMKKLGDTDEVVLSKALQYITTGSVPVSDMPKGIFSGTKKLSLKKYNKGMVLDSKLLSKIKK